MLDSIKTGSWIDKDRLLVYPAIIMVLTLAAMTYVLAVNGGMLPNGSPFGSDFISFWTAAREAVAGNPQVAYDRSLFEPVQSSLFPQSGYFAFFYPPHYLMYLLPLGVLPYYAALAVWLLVTFALAYWVLAQIIGHKKELLLLAIAFPATFLTISHGQNAFLSGALFGGGLLLLERRPLLAGVCFGLLTFKPQLGLLIPLVLIASGQWRVIFSAGMTFVVLVILSAASFGIEIWTAFFSQTDYAMQTMREGLVAWQKMISVYAGLRIAGLSNSVASILHWTTAALVTAMTIWAWLPRNQIDANLKNALVLTSALIVTPFGLNYDMFLLAPALVFYVAHGLRTGFLPYEKSALVVLYFSPILVLMAMGFGFSPAPVFIIGMFGLTLRRLYYFGVREKAGSSQLMVK